MPRILLLIFFTLCFGSLFGQMASISGRSTDYAGKELIFFTYTEPVTHQQVRLASTTIGADGTFNLSFKLDQPTEIYADLEKYRGTLVAEPGMHYQISLPAFSPRTAQEAASPYFEPELYWLGIKDAKTTDLNSLVRAFLTDYNRELVIHTQDLYQKKSLDTLKTIVARLEKSYPNGNHPYLNTLKTYSFGEIEYTVRLRDKEGIAKKYFASKEVYLAHPAYQHLFRSMFSDFMIAKSQDIREKEFIRPGLQGNFSEFVNNLNGKGFKREIAELVAVKSFYDGFYSNKFDRQNMLKGLKEAEKQCSFEPLKAALPGILSRISSLQEGAKSPEIVLRNQKGAETTLRSNGKFIYLAFFRSESQESRAELDSLVSLDKKLNSILTIVPVSMNKNFQDAIKLWNEKKYPWELTQAVHPDQATVDYRIKAVPTFYLISPDMKLMLSPALSPSHNFESLFLKIYRESRFRK